MKITYYEYYPHYMGTTTATVSFTRNQFDELLDLAKVIIKNHKDGNDEGEDEAQYKLDQIIDEIEKKQGVEIFALGEALLNYFDSPRRPSTIASAIKKKGVWVGEWEEGSFAFATTKKKAVDAVRQIEAKHLGF